MEITRTPDGLLLAKLDPFIVELLLKIPDAADPGENAAARDRLYSRPGDDPATNAEWQEYVEPELRKIFETANETVRRDLAQIREGTRKASLLVPAAHYENWLSTLNQSRLALAVKHEFTDAELAAEEALSLENERELSLFQIHFYGFLQECLIREINRSEETGDPEND